MFMVADPCLKSLYLVADTIVVKTSKFHGEIHSNVYPALAGVGYICGLKIATLMFAGSLLGWVVIIPMIHTFGQDSVMFPAKITIGEIWENAGAAGLWSSYLRYIGAGAVAGAGIISLIKNLPSMFKSFGASVKGLKNSSGSASSERTDRDQWVVPQRATNLMLYEIISYKHFHFLILL